MHRANSLVNNLPPHVWVSDRAVAVQKLTKILDGGSKLVHLVADFDMTLTKYLARWQPSSHSVVERSSIVSQEMLAESQALYHTYYPIESSHSIPMVEKISKMREWWSKSHDLILRLGMKRQDITNMVKETPMVWRDKVDQVIQLTQEKEIPVMVFSAGIEDIICEILRTAGLLRPHVHVVSNKLVFNNDMVTGFSDPLIHVFNKSEVVIDPTSTHFKSICDRGNVILMGDSPGDIHMADGLQHDCCLKIGFLNHDTEAWKTEFSSRYDIIVTKDQGMDCVVQLLQAL